MNTQPHTIAGYQRHEIYLLSGYLRGLRICDRLDPNPDDLQFLAAASDVLKALADGMVPPPAIVTLPDPATPASGHPGAPPE